MGKLKLSGHVKVWKNNILIFEDKNTIGTFLKEYLASRLNSDTNSALFLGGDEGFYATGAIGGNDAGYVVVNASNVGDGIIISEALAGNDHYGLDTVVHPTDPNGIYYAQWQAQMTAGATFEALGLSIDEIAIGNDFDIDNANGGGNIWASKIGLGPFVLVDTDVLTIDWKIIIQ